ncbi:histone acetyltransferase 1 [Lithohypha guttulata]|uniref:Histone acetyltransferase type B catalytic subunit n=1 Tax=Lithohypha guttulata TaxID=1690604 RepID=A0AAN7SXN6_9EURO|nr:histone acetyltransferase 1 [Lithohypha guttulata]
MASTEEEWSVSANDAVVLSMVRPGSDGIETVAEFSPTFTYPIFGEAEQIFGYKELEIGIQFAAHDGSPHVDISYKKKFPGVKSTQALDLNKTLKEFLPPSAFQQDYDERLQNERAQWTPPGELVHKYSKKGQDFEVWAGSLLDPKVKQLVNNVQILVLFYIEAGSLLNLDEVDWSLDRWRVYFVYEKATPSTAAVSSYTFMGYSTTYRFWRYAVPRTQATQGSIIEHFPNLPSISPKQLDSRLRVSQFLLLPPYQKSGHGSQLYQAIYNEVIADQTIYELTVEDPSEEFDQLRDSCDWKVLEPQFRAAHLAIDASKPAGSKRIERVPTAVLLPLEVLTSIRTKNKIAPRQFARLTELYLLSLIPFSHRSTGGASLTKLKLQKHTNKDVNDRIYYWWRILLKQRIYRKNKDVLRQADTEEKFNGLEDSARGQEDEYEGLLMLFALRQASAQGLTGNGESSIPRKRPVVEDDDEEEVGELEVSMPKRARP